MAAGTLLTGRGGAAVAVLVLAAAGALAMMGYVPSCEDRSDAKVLTVKLADRWFHLEMALTDEVRYKGMGGRTHIEPDGGMLFAFRHARPMNFVMRDCSIPIDLIFLDGSGRIVAMHEMLPEPPRGPDEGTPGQTEPNEKYDTRLKSYPSRFSSQFAIELAGGTLKTLSLKEGDRVDLDTNALKTRTE